MMAQALLDAILESAAIRGAQGARYWEDRFLRGIDLSAFIIVPTRHRRHVGTMRTATRLS
jgi:hypothetical protein